MKEQQHTKQPDQYAALPVFQSHKRVRAARITWIARDGQKIRLEMRYGELNYRYFIDDEWLSKNHPVVGGYFVVYDDGYTSYSPAHAFESGYSEFIIGVDFAAGDDQSAEMEIESFKSRVIDERIDLSERLGKLLSFFQSPTFSILSEAERSRLRNQARFMDGYAAVLEERIAAFDLKQ